MFRNWNIRHLDLTFHRLRNVLRKEQYHSRKYYLWMKKYVIQYLANHILITPGSLWWNASTSWESSCWPMTKVDLKNFVYSIKRDIFFIKLCSCPMSECFQNISTLAINKRNNSFCINVWSVQAKSIERIIKLSLVHFETLFEKLSCVSTMEIVD